MMWRFVVVAFVASVTSRAYAQPAGDDFKQTKEWKALNRYVGTWENEVTVTVPEPKRTRSLETVAWILGDRFLQNRSQSGLDNSEELFLLTYDPNRRAMRSWGFSSGRQGGVSTGSWDEATSTLTLKVEDVAPGSCTITDRFIDDGHREGRVIFKDADGKIVFESVSKATRQKKTAEKPAPGALTRPRDGDFKQTREWKALNRYVGMWDNQATTTVPERKQSRSTPTAAWILGDRFVQMKEKAADGEGMYLLTYDPNHRVIRFWLFNSSGQASASTGSWDEATSTLTLKVDDPPPGGSGTFTDRFSDEDHHEWQWFFKDADGKVVFEVSGKAMRQKKPTEQPATGKTAQPAADDFKQTKEWKALNRYVGTWDNQATTTVPECKQSRSTPTAAWVLGDRLLQINEKAEDGTESMHLFGYDQNRRAMRWWSFDSRGGSRVATGSWDEATSTFSFKTEDTEPMSGTLTDRFIDDDHHEWKFTFKDADGKVISEASGTVARQKNAAGSPPIDPGAAGNAPRTVAETVTQSKINASKLLKGVLMYANEHQGAFPDSIEQVVDPYIKTSEVLRNPRQPGREKGYIWVKPARQIQQIRRPSETIVLYEAYDKWPDGGLVVGFIDGHVELLKDESAFKQKLRPPNATP